MIEKHELLDVGDVTRYHASEVSNETLGHHMWGVAILCMMVWPDRHDLLKAALLHDAHELIVGDVPSPAKRLSDDFRRAYEILEYKIDEGIREKLGADIFPVLDEQDKIRLRAADIGHLCLYSYQDYVRGNTLAKKTYLKGREYLFSLIRREPELLESFTFFYDKRIEYLKWRASNSD